VLVARRRRYRVVQRTVREPRGGDPISLGVGGQRRGDDGVMSRATTGREAALKGVAEAGPVPLPDPPYTCEVTFVGTSSAAMAALVPTVHRRGPRGVTFEAPSVDALHRCFRVVAKLGATATEPRYG
jgi:hypothetical protein